MGDFWRWLSGCCPADTHQAHKTHSWDDLIPAPCYLHPSCTFSLTPWEASPVLWVINPHMRLSSVHLMAGDNCSNWSGHRHGSSLWDLLSLDLYQDPGGRNIPASPHITTGDLLTSLWYISRDGLFCVKIAVNLCFQLSSLQSGLQTAAFPCKPCPVPKQRSIPRLLGSGFS